MAQQRTVTADLTITGFCSTSAIIVKNSLKTSDYTVTTDDYYIGVQVSTQAVTITLPESSPAGQVFIVADTNGLATTSLPINIVPSGSDTINGSSVGTAIIGGWSALSFISNGSGYNIF